MTPTLAPPALEAAFLSAFEQARPTLLNGTATPKIHAKRKAAIAEFERLGLPTRKSEDWRYTNIAAVLKKGYTHTPDLRPPATLPDLSAYRIPNLDVYQVVIVNGQYVEAGAQLDDLPDGVTVSSLKQAMKDHPDIVEAHFGQYADTSKAPFVALNTAFATDGYFIHVRRGVQVDKPIQVVHLTQTDDTLIFHTRNLLVAEQGASVKVIESYHTHTSDRTFANVLTEVFTAENAHVQRYKIQDEGQDASQVYTTHGYQEGNSTFLTFNAAFGGATVRNNLYLHPDGEHCDTLLHGLSLIRGRQHVDHHTFVDHAKPNCHSNELYKGILDERSALVFRGKLFVRLNAQKTNAYQTNQNLMLTEDASVTAQPQLEIYADDVKCSHGATTGHVDDDAVFYFRARGIPEKKARVLLMQAFIHEVTEEIRIPALKDHLNAIVDERLNALV